MSLLDKSLGEIATTIPGATSVFHQYKLDFCCGGHQSLGEALAKKQLSPTQVVEQLQKLLNSGETMMDWRSVPVKQLIEHILERYHQRHRQQLPELCRLARRVEHVHAAADDCPTGLADHLEDMYQELESHMMKEEQILFPDACQRYSTLQVRFPLWKKSIFNMATHCKSLMHSPDNITLPDGACNTWTALYLG